MRKFAFLAVLVCLAVPATAADFDWGVRTGVYMDQGDAFLGVEALTPITRSFYFNPNIEWVFIDGGDLATVNADVHYDFEVGTRRFAWAGAGLALGWVNTNDDDETDLGANLFAGYGAQMDWGRPYAQVKYVNIDEFDDIVLAVGVRF